MSPAPADHCAPPERPDEPLICPESGASLHPALGQTPLFNLVYCSRAAASLDDAAMDSILASARRRNPVAGITGMLVFGSGVFVQWLEGPRHSIHSLMTVLRADTRHADITELSQCEELRERLFPDWAMEHVAAEDMREVLADALTSAGEGDTARVLRSLLAQLDAGGLAELAAAGGPGRQAAASPG